MWKNLGQAFMFALERWQPGPVDPKFLNVGTGLDFTIHVLSEAATVAMGYRGKILWDAENPIAPQRNSWA